MVLKCLWTGAATGALLLTAGTGVAASLPPDLPLSDTLIIHAPVQTAEGNRHLIYARAFAAQQGSPPEPVISMIYPVYVDLYSCFIATDAQFAALADNHYELLRQAPVRWSQESWRTSSFLNQTAEVISHEDYKNRMLPVLQQATAEGQAIIDEFIRTFSDARLKTMLADWQASGEQITVYELGGPGEYEFSDAHLDRFLKRRTEQDRWIKKLVEGRDVAGNLHYPPLSQIFSELKGYFFPEEYLFFYDPVADTPFSRNHTSNFLPPLTRYDPALTELVRRAREYIGTYEPLLEAEQDLALVAERHSVLRHFLNGGLTIDEIIAEEEADFMNAPSCSLSILAP